MITVRKSQGLMHLLPLSRFELQEALEAMLLPLGLEGGDLELALLDEAAMAALNLRHLGCAGPTNVLSFPAEEHGFGGQDEALVDKVGREAAGEESALPSGLPVLGLLALAPHMVRREAFLYGQELTQHTLWLLAHGVTHLAGMEHGPEMDALAEVCLEAALERLG